MSIHETLKAQIPEALRAHDEIRLRTLRSVVTLMTNEVMAKKRKPDEFLTDDEAMAVLKRAANQRKDSIEAFEAAGRMELSGGEKEELEVIQSFLPSQLSHEEVVEVVKAKMEELGIASKADAGRFTGAVMKDLAGRADGAMVKSIIDSLLT